MVKEIELDGKGWARGRNGYFIPRRMDCFKDVRGTVNLSVSSSRAGKNEPISLRITQADAAELGNLLLVLAGTRKRTPRVVVVIEGGNVQEIMADRPGIHVVKVDYDVDGTPRQELRRIQQADKEGKRSFALASVRNWGEATVFPKDTNRIFRNARD